LLPVAAGVVAACSSARAPDATEDVAQRSDAVWARDDNGAPVASSDRDEGLRNVVVRIPTKNLPAGASDTACTGVLLTPSLLLTSKYCVSAAKGTTDPIVQVGATKATLVTRALAGSAFPITPMPSATSATGLDPSDIVLVGLKLPVPGEAYLVANDRPSLDAPALSARMPTPVAGGNRKMGKVEIVGWSPFGIGEDGTTVMTPDSRQSTTIGDTNVYSLTLDGAGPFLVREVYDVGRPSTARAGLHSGDVGGPLYFYDAPNGPRRLVGLATTLGMTGTPAEDGTELPAERPTPSAIPGTRCNETSCDVWIDLTSPAVKAFIADKAARTMGGARWQASHPRADGKTGWWYGESDSPGGTCDKTKDKDCDGWFDINANVASDSPYRKRDNCPNVFNPDQRDDDEDGFGNACDGDCVPTSCAAQGKNCGTIPDQCGNTLYCGGCSGYATCGAPSTPNVCVVNTRWFDTTQWERDRTGSGFNDLETVGWTQASRVASQICTERGFSGGQFNGFARGEFMGLVCYARGTRWFDITQSELNATGWGFGDVNTVAWAQASRAAFGYCTQRGYVGGQLNGFQGAAGVKGVICIGSDVAQWFDVTRQDIWNTGWRFDDTNLTAWAQAARAANSLCNDRGFVSGRFNGHQYNGRFGLVCYR
jgi:hypothetical protein